MAEVTIKKDGKIEPALPVTDIRVNVLELVEGTVTNEGSRRIFRGKYADGGTVEVSIDLADGDFSAKGNCVLTEIADGSDRSHAVLTYLPKNRQLKKKTH